MYFSVERKKNRQGQGWRDRNVENLAILHFLVRL